VTTGVFEGIGNQVAEQSILAKKTVQVMLTGEDALMKFLKTAPADIRAAVSALIEELKRKSNQLGFPIPRAPSESRRPPLWRRNKRRGK
jgi:hypothetical protein